MDKILENLQSFNFTKIEAEVYICLLKYGQLNGSQISKYLSISRTSVYAALESLYNKGHVFMLSGEPTMYKAEEPKQLIDKIKRGYSNSIDYLEKYLSSFESRGSEEQYWNIKGYDNFINNTKRLLLSAESEVYISTNFQIQLFKDELIFLSEKGVKIIIFSFEPLDMTEIIAEYYHHEAKTIYCSDKRWMMVVDNKQAFIANENKNKEIFGTFTGNSLMVSIISEHIHHDIYLLKLKNKYNKNIVTEDILIGSSFEKGSETCGGNPNK
ncbi:sugar-specific transcriptional regulator, TrmB family [Clostridiales bacterium oral taxon 876 str. F0540]|nr:sugar-specific transcriptional regulator, TrmB family [Clostridiales bacterium oral taxon 876 str. F0540]